MESGDFIITDLPFGIRKKMIKSSLSKEQLKGFINEYIETHFKEWFRENTKTLEESFETIDTGNEEAENGTYTEAMEEYFTDEFKNQLTNNWTATNYNFFRHFEDELKCVSIKDFIKIWKECSEWYEEKFGEVSLKDEEHAWNTICYWIFEDNLFDSWKDTFDFEYREQFEEYKDKKNKKSRIPCGVCYENTILYTGCFKCNNNYLCRGCYIRLESENECPFCRHDEMICSTDTITGMSNELFHHSVHFQQVVLKNLVREVENEVMDNCKCCEKELRWKDKAKIIEEDGNEFIFCIPCYKKKTRTIEGYKSLDESTPEGQEGQYFQDWIFKITPQLHRIKRKWDFFSITALFQRSKM